MTTIRGFSQRHAAILSAVIPVPQRPFDASGRFENGHSAASSFAMALKSACLDAGLKPALSTVSATVKPRARVGAEQYACCSWKSGSLQIPNVVRHDATDDHHPPQYQFDSHPRFESTYACARREHLGACRKQDIQA